MHPSRYLTCAVKTRHCCLSFIVYLQTAILIMQGWINKHGLFADVNAVSLELDMFGRQFFSHRAFTMQRFYHGRIKPHANPANWSHDALLFFKTLSDNAGRLYIPRLQREAELLAVNIDKLRTKPPHLFRDKQPYILLRIYCACRVILG